MLKAVLIDQTAATYDVKHGKRKQEEAGLYLLSGKRLIISWRNSWLSCGIAISKIVRNKGN
jgi:hypothetical protein